MTDEELIRWLRNLGPMDYELRHGAFQTAAADRIEALVKERDAEKTRAELLDVALRFYADFYENPNDGPWGIDSQDYGDTARAALKGADQ